MTSLSWSKSPNMFWTLHLKSLKRHIFKSWRNIVNPQKRAIRFGLFIYLASFGCCITIVNRKFISQQKLKFFALYFFNCTRFFCVRFFLPMLWMDDTLPPVSLIQTFFVNTNDAAILEFSTFLRESISGKLLLKTIFSTKANIGILGSRH